MKVLFTLLVLVGAFELQAQTIKSMEIKKSMIERTDKMITLVGEIRDHLEEEKLDADKACAGISELYKLNQAHVMEIGTRMDLFKLRTAKIRNQAQEQLMIVHVYKGKCEQGKDHEYINPTEMRSVLKRFGKQLKKHKKAINKDDCDSENSYQFQYHVEY